MIYRTGLLCLLAVIASAGCRRTDGPPTSAPAGDVLPPRLPAQLPALTNPAAAGEFMKFAGTWVVTGAELDGVALPEQVGQEYTFAVGKLTLRNGDRVLDTATVVLDPSAMPKAVDLISDHLREGEASARFIYEFDADMLRLCRGDKERPTSFVGKELVVFTLKRKKS